MPTYEYACQKCGYIYEKRQGFDASPRQRCPKCRGSAQRVLYAPPIVFKGSGFYVTDSRKSEPAVAGDSSSEKPEATSTSGKSEKAEKSAASDKSEKKESGTSSSEPEAAAAG